MENSVEVKKLCFSYDKETSTLDNISFSIKKGEYVTILGHNGSGKSTLAKLIMGLLAPNSGEIFIDNELLTEQSVLRLRKNIGIVFQNPDNQFIGSTVRDDIAFGLENKCVSSMDMENLVESFAKFVGMENFLDKEPSNLSGGQKQRVAIAGILAMEPNIIIFDEATAMLDPKGRNDIRKLISKTREKNKDITIISITHDIDEASMADKVIVLNKGKVFLEGTPKEVFKNNDLLVGINLDIPVIEKLVRKLNDLGAQIGEVKSIQELGEKLCQ